MQDLKNRKRWPFGWLMPLAFFGVGLLYLYAAPHFEASDNIQHIGVIYWLRERGELPVQSAEHERMYGQQASQPPLYYLLMSTVFSAFDTSDREDYFQRNPLAIVGVPARLGNRNLAHYRQPYPPDLNGTSLALYVIRLFSLGMSTVTVAAVYQAARTIMPERVGFALIATGLTAFNPQFIFIGASVSNDSLVTMLSSLIAWQTLVMLRRGFDTRRSLLLALLAPLAILAKLSGFAALLGVGAAALWLLYKTGDRRGFFILSLSMLLGLLLITGWWFLRNLTLYGELVGTATMLDFFGRRSTTVPRLFLEEFEGLRVSYWGLFGTFSIYAHRIFYSAMDLLSLISLAGLPFFLFKMRRNSFILSAVAVLGIMLFACAAMLTWWSLQTTASTGRLLFPVISSISALMAMGLFALRIPALLICLPLFAYVAAVPFLHIYPNYDHPPQVDALPAAAIETEARWGDIDLLGYEVPPPRRWAPGDEIPITLYWRPLKQSEEPLALFISLVDAEGDAIATIDSFPGWGTLPTTWWTPGRIYRDDYILQIPQDAAVYSTVGLHIGWYDWTSRVNIMPTREADVESKSFILPVGAFVGNDNGEALPDGATPAGLVFGDVIRLKRFRFVDGRALELEWQLLREMSGDWRVFAHALAEPYQVNAPVETALQKDSSPAVPLDYLAIGEAFITRHDFDLPADYRKSHDIYIGWYNDDTVARLEIPQEDNMLLIGEFDFYA